MSIEQHEFRAPGESEDYRRARNALLEAELALIDQIEKVAEQRRALPPGGKPPEDYEFEEGPADLRDTQTVNKVKLSELFAPGKDTLVLINTMFKPGAELPCPACNSLADGYNATAPHISDRVNFALVTKAPLGQLRAWAAARDWRDIRLLSSYNNSFNRDYHTENESGDQSPSITVFHKHDNGVIRHFYSVEPAMWSAKPGRDPRQLDLYWPLWQLLDLTPEGRGKDWYPRYSYRDEVTG